MKNGRRHVVPRRGGAVNLIDMVPPARFKPFSSLVGLLLLVQWTTSVIVELVGGNAWVWMKCTLCYLLDLSMVINRFPCKWTHDLIVSLVFIWIPLRMV